MTKNTFIFLILGIILIFMLRDLYKCPQYITTSNRRPRLIELFNINNVLFGRRLHQHRTEKFIVPTPSDDPRHPKWMKFFHIDYVKKKLKEDGLDGKRNYFVSPKNL